MVITVAPAFAGLTKCIRPDWKKLRKIVTRTPRWWLDLVILIPFSVIVSLPSTSNTPMAILEVHKLLRVLKLRQYASVVEDIYAKHFVTLKLLKMLTVTILLSHGVACARFWFGDNADDHHNEWLQRDHPPNGHVWTQRTPYLMSLFWAFGLLTGLFEGELPRTIFEFIFTIFVALCGFALFTYLCATFFMISRSEAGYTATAEARISQFKHVLAFHRVPLNLQEQAIEYLKNFYTYADANDREAIRLLCPSITKDIQVALLKDTIASIPFFLGCNEQFIIAITSLLEMVALPANTVIFEAGAFGDSMYVVNSGVLHVVVGGTKVADVRKGGCFGEMAIFLDCPRTATIVTATYCTVYRLLRLNVERVLEGYPQYAKTIPKKVEVLTRSLGLLTAKAIALARRPSSSGNDNDSEGSGSTRNLASIIRQTIVKQKTRAQLDSDVGATSAGRSTGRSTGRSAGRRTSVQKSTGRRNSLQPIESERRLSVRSVPGELGRRMSLPTKVFDAILRQMKSKQVLFVRSLPKYAVDPDSTRRMWWICALQLVLVFNWVMVPLQLAFSLLDTTSWVTTTLNVLCDVILWLDIYWSFALAYTEQSEKIIDIRSTARRYLRGGFWVDLVCVFPWDLLPVASVHHSLLRLPRLARVWRVGGHYREVDAYFRIENKHRLALFALLLVMLYHVTACLYFSVSYLEKFSDDVNAWLPSLRPVNASWYVDGGHEWIDSTSVSTSTVVATQYLRSLYFASYVLTALGRTIEPASDTQYMIALAFMLTGFVITAVVVDNVQKRCTASAHEQKEFVATRLKIQLFLRRQHAPLAIHKRVNSFLDFWWFAHRGAMIGEIINELPEALKRDIMRWICAPALQTLALLPDGEVIYHRGDHATGMFFLLEGAVELHVGAREPRELPTGSFFGTIAMQEDAPQHCHVDNAIAISGSIMLFLDREQLAALKKHFPTFASALMVLEQRLTNSKLAHASTKIFSRRGSVNVDVSKVRIAKSKWFRWIRSWLRMDAIDPESPMVGAWEAFIFVVMTAQSGRCIFYLCFGVTDEERAVVGATTAFLEVFFLIDMLLRLRLGYSRFGNTVMDKRMIWRRYLRSFAFSVDVLALLPLYLYNEVVAKERWLPLININKLVRLLRVPQHFRTLEDRFLKYTTELRLFKLLYYTFLLSHLFGCIWFNFGSQSATNSIPQFGANLWMPPVNLTQAPRSQQYAASLFWAFGLMSASSPGELPKTIGQCLFSVVVMTTGFFLFAYVIGNFSDVIELNDAENRAFYAKLSSLRHFLRHFRVAKPMAHKFKMYFFFRRFHSITQEHLLARCLPPSLLTDIRIVHLKPMIAKVAFLAGMDANITHLLVSRFTQLLITGDEYVYKLGDEGSDMYFVFTGLLFSLLPADELAREASMLDRQTANPTLLGDRTSVEDGPDDAKRSDANNAEDSEASTLKKVGEISAGSYFGESVLLTSSTRTSFVQAQASCILYSLSRHSLELVFDRHPEWKQMVLRSMKIHQEQQKWLRLEREELKPIQSQPGHRSFAAKLDLFNAIAERTEADILQMLKPQRQSLTKKKSSFRGLAMKMEVSQAEQTRRRQRTVTPTKKKTKRKSLLPPGMSSLFTGTAAQSPAHLVWLHLVVAASLYVAILEPYRVAFESLEVTHWFMGIVRELEVVCDVVFILDVCVIYRLKQSIDSMELYEQDHRVAYVKERMTIDILAFLPIDYMLSNIGTLRKSPWLRLNRCLKMWHFGHYTFELHRDSISIELHRLASSTCLYLMMMYWTAVLYFIVSLRDGYGDDWNAWVPSEDLDFGKHNVTGELRTLRLLRGFFFATTALVKKGRTFIPTTTLHLLFTVVVCFIGLLCMAFMIGEIAGLLISYINHEVEYRKNHIAVEMYLSRWKISGELRDRAHMYLSSLWASHRGVDYQQLLDEVPSNIRTEAILAITNWPLMAFVEDVLRPIHPVYSGGVDTAQPLLQIIAPLLKFEGYSRDENVVVEGSISKAMYFVVRGHLCAISAAHDNAYRGLSYKGSDYFGEKGLLGYSTSACTVRTLRSCDLMSLDSTSLHHALRSDQVSSIALALAEAAVHTMRFQEPLKDVAAMEERWGHALLAAINLRLLECATTDMTVSFAGQRLRAILRTRFNVDTADEAFKLFQSLLHLMVPHGALYNFGNCSNPKRGVDADRSFNTNGSTTEPTQLSMSGSSSRSIPIPVFTVPVGSSTVTTTPGSAK
ncbi:TPA: hypothetical protein N0F65_003703 [Lagenidium giganteum]|uniref:Cyclic nucleotide-binding domain-containing protein n=1 Tax=Lagenidium giganteum TaxID=4803 RepID=A0AAV2Z051_9STRA|nr:TPA: hypothetical protein N0F65_003703 [Lagenidium giganteum]